MNKECNNFELDIREGNKRLTNIKNETSDINNEYNEIHENINDVKLLIKEIEETLRINTSEYESISVFKKVNLEWEDRLFLSNDYLKLEENINNEVYKNP